MRRHYVYYRIPAAALPEVVHAVKLMQGRLRSRYPGLLTALLRRPEVTAEQLTLMEVYSLFGSDLHGDVATAIEALASAALARWTDGPRHVETFEVLAEA